MEYNCNISIIDNAAGVSAGMAAYRFVRRIMRPEYLVHGSVIRTGCVLIAGFAGIKVGTIVRDQTQGLRLELNSFIGGNVKNEVTKEQIYESFKQRKEILDDKNQNDNMTSFNNGSKVMEEKKDGESGNT